MNVEQVWAWVQKGGFCTVAQAGAMPFLLALAALVWWRAVKIGRLAAAFILFILGLVPWALGALSYVVGYTLANKAAVEAVDAIQREAFLRKTRELLNQGWYIPAVVTPVFLILIVLALRKPKPVSSPDFRG